MNGQSETGLDGIAAEKRYVRPYRIDYVDAGS